MGSKIPVEWGYSIFSREVARKGSIEAFGVGRRVSAKRLFARCGLGSRGKGTACAARARKIAFEALADAFAERLEASWHGIDALIVNAEGTIHSDAPGAHALLALCVVAKRFGKTVVVTNGSFYKLSDYLLEALQKSADYIAVREPVSWRYLKEKRIKATLSADCLFLMDKGVFAGIDVFPYADGQPYAVYTPGVLASTGRVTETTVKSDIGVIKAAGVKPLYYIVEQEDERFARTAANCGALVVPLGAMGVRELVPFLSGANFIVSGRYHMNIFAALAGTPFLPLQSNTPKVEALLEILGVKGGFVREWSGEKDGVELLDLEKAVCVAPEEIASCAELARKAIPDFLRVDGS